MTIGFECKLNGTTLSNPKFSYNEGSFMKYFSSPQVMLVESKIEWKRILVAYDGYSIRIEMDALLAEEYLYTHGSGLCF